MSKKKEKVEYDKLLQKYQSKKECVKIHRSVTGGSADIFGVILKFSNEFMHLAEFENFKFQNEVVIRMDHYDSIGSDKFDKTYQRILKKEKQISKSKPKRSKVDLSSWKTLFKDLKDADTHVIIECEDLKNPSFTIGPIIKINKKSVEIRHYDATGQLEKKLSRINYKNITLVKFNDEYLKTFRKYLKNPKK